MTLEKKRPARGGIPAGRDALNGGADEQAKGRASESSAQATRSLPFPLRIFRASRPHAHDRGEPRQRRRPTSPAQLPLPLEGDGYDPRQRNLFGWAR